MRLKRNRDSETSEYESSFVSESGEATSCATTSATSRATTTKKYKLKSDNLIDLFNQIIMLLKDILFYFFMNIEKEEETEDDPRDNYYKKLDEKDKKYIDDIENQIKEIDGIKEEVPLKYKIIQSSMDIALKKYALGKINHLSTMSRDSGEYAKLHNYINGLIQLPIGKYINALEDKKDINVFLENVKKNLDKCVFGHEETKTQIMILLAKWFSNPSSKGMVIGIEGPMGNGKTTLCKEGICKSLGLPFGFVSLGGINDGSHLVGFDYTYDGSRCGKIADILMKTKCMNPVLYFDELDKVSTTKYGDEIINTLIHLTDSSQNDSFHDKYFSNIDFDLSKCLIIFSYNDENLINPILRDRMVTIKTSGYSLQDKIQIGKNYLIPQILANYGFEKSDLVFDDEVLSFIINETSEEKGVRNFKRSIDNIVGHFNLEKFKNKFELPMRITSSNCKKFIPKKKEDAWLSMYI